MNLAPIVLFVYNRPDHTRRTLEALSENELADRSNLFVFCDGPKENADEDSFKATRKVRELVKSKPWCKTVTLFESEKNKGLADSIRDGVSRIILEFGKIIVLEDDIMTAKGFLTYMNKALNLYEYEDRVMHIGSYLPYTNSIAHLPETFFSRFMSCWGWGTWKRAWDKANWNELELYDQIKDPAVRYQFNLEGVLNFHEQLEQNIEGRIKTWAIMWFSSIFLEKGLCLYPGKTLSENIGMDGTGVHCDPKSSSVIFKPSQHIPVKRVPIVESSRGKKYLKRYYLYGLDSNWKKRVTNHYIQKRYQLIKRIKGL